MSNQEDNQVHFYGFLENKLQQYTNRDDHILIGGDFNFIYDKNMDRKGGYSNKPNKNRERIIKHLENIKEYYQLKDIWRIKNPDTKRFTCRRINPVIKSRLDFWLITEKTEDFINETDIIPFNNTDHSAITLKLSSQCGKGRGKGIWRLNASFLEEEPYVKAILENKEAWLEEVEDVTDPRVKWEFIKYRIRQFIICQIWNE